MIAISAMVLAAAFSSRGLAGEIIDNEKLMEMINGGLSPKFIMSKIASSPKDCHFVSNVKDNVAIQKACKAIESDVKWSKEEVDALQSEVNRLALAGLNEMKNLVNLFLTAAENDDINIDPKMYEE